MLLLVLATTGCEEASSTLVTEIGTVGFVLTDPALSSPAVAVGTPEITFQNVVWELTAPADLARVDGSATQDLLFGVPCRYVQTTKSSFNPDGACAGGVILGSTDDFGSTVPAEVPVTLSMVVDSMELTRAKPLELEPLGDYDADRVRNDSDNCPLLPNPDQTDSNGDRVGDVCSVTDYFGNIVPDNDGDGVADGSDNCVWYQNPLQEDTTGVSADYGIPDGIGDACEEQKATVTGTPLTLVFDDEKGFKVSLATGGVSFVTVDFDDTVALVACDWDAGTCDLVEDSVDACGIPSSIDLSLLGC